MAKNETRRELVGPQRERITHLSTLQLVREIAVNASLLVRKQVELARTELRADVRTEAKVAGGLTLAAVGAIITVTLLLVTAAFALALVMPAWGAGLIVSGVMAAVVGVLAGLSWRRRIRKPLATSRTALSRDIRFTKERFA
jgi:uncharacterized membrane protein YeiB